MRKLKIRQEDGWGDCEDCGCYSWRYLEVSDAETGAILWSKYGGGHLSGDDCVREPLEVLSGLLPSLGFAVETEEIEIP